MVGGGDEVAVPSLVGWVLRRELPSNRGLEGYSVTGEATQGEARQDEAGEGRHSFHC